MSKDDFGIPALFKQLEAFDQKLRRKILKKAMKDGAKIVASEIKRRAPVDTGATKKSVKVKAGKRSRKWIQADIVIEGAHADPSIGLEEFGRRDRKPNPFIRPAASEKKNEVIELVANEIQSGIAQLKSSPSLKK